MHIPGGATHSCTLDRHDLPQVLFPHFDHGAAFPCYFETKRDGSAGPGQPARAKAADLGGNVVQLKLKTADFKIVTRRHTLDRPTQLARRLFETGSDLLSGEATGKRYRLIGIGLADLVPAGKTDEADLFDQKGARKDAAERAMDKVREKFGSSAIKKGRSL